MSARAHAISPTVRPTDYDHSLIDRIIYLGSLASVRRDIDPMMDTIRGITASWQPEHPLATQDRSALEGLESQLKAYLVARDPLRSFTSQDLEKRLQTQGRSKVSGISNHIRALGATLIGAVVAAVLPFVIPVSLALTTRLTVGVTLLLVVISLGTLWFYLTALRNFKPELRRSFLYICVGVIFLALESTHYAIIQLFGLGDHPVFRYAGLTWLITLSFVFIFLGLRTYARILGIKTRFASWPAFVLGLATTTAIAILLPHNSHILPADLGYYQFAFSGLTSLIAATAFGAVIARQILRSVTPAYARSIRWLFWYLTVGSVASVGSTAALYLIGELHGTVFALIDIAGGITPQVILLYSGYLFKKETSR